jgi:anti-anti-sigma factor
VSDGQLEVEVHAGLAGVVLCVAGELDLASAGRLVDALRLLGPTQAVLVDASGLTFADLGGLRPLLERARSSRVAIANPPPILRRLVDVCGLDELLRLDGEG